MRVFVESLGCSRPDGTGHDLERRLHERGHSIAPVASGADVGLFVACSTVRTAGVRAARRWRLLAEQVPHVVLTGCVAPTGDFLSAGPGLDRTSFVPVDDTIGLSEAIDRLGLLPGPAGPTDDLGSPRTTVAEVLVTGACADACAYCARAGAGPTPSVAMVEVVRRVERARDRGASEIALAAPDTSAWGEDVPDGPRLPDLLRTVSSISGGFRLRLGPMDPRSLGPIATPCLKTLAAAKAFRFLQLPLRSGSDAVLGAMGRSYTVDGFRRIVRTARACVPDVVLSTEVAVGHPRETEDDFRATLQFLEEISPDVVQARCYSSSSVDGVEPTAPVSSRVARRRAREVSELATRVARERLARWVGWEGNVVISEEAPDGGSLGRLPNYLPLLLPERLSLGALAPVRVRATTGGFLEGVRTGPAEAAAPIAA